MLTRRLEFSSRGASRTIRGATHLRFAAEGHNSYPAGLL
jgi:hypothetical protein